MSLRFWLLIVLFVVWGNGGLPVEAKPPELPAAPFTEFKVLSPYVQDFNQPENSSGLDVFVTHVAAGFPELNSTTELGAIAGMGIACVSKRLTALPRIVKH